MRRAISYVAILVGALVILVIIVNVVINQAGKKEELERQRQQVAQQAAHDEAQRQAEQEAARRRAEEEARHRLGETWEEPVTGMEFVWIPRGTFTMGSPSDEKDRDSEEVQHQVTVSGFWMGRCEVTVGQFRTFVDETGYKTEAEKEGWSYAWKDWGVWGEAPGVSWRNPGFAQTTNHPVVCVSWNDAKAFADWMSGRSGGGFRLPTESEWEYACRAGTATARFWGTNPDDACTYCNAADTGHDWARVVRPRLPDSEKYFSPGSYFSCDDGYEFTSPVGHYHPNKFGLYDMLGNVWEWCSDWYDRYPSGSVTDPTGPSSGSIREIRGGAWISDPRQVRSAFRHWNAPSERIISLGFRLARVQP